MKRLEDAGYFLSIYALLVDVPFFTITDMDAWTNAQGIYEQLKGMNSETP